MPTTRSGEGIGFQDKDTINLEELSNTNGYLPMVQSGINYKVRPTELKRDAVAVCSTASATVGKTATVNNMPDFILVNGTVITVYFENKNTAAEPTLNINNSGSWPLKLPNQANNIVIGSGCWNDGFIAEVKYVEISDNNKFFLLLGHNVASVNDSYTILADGTTVYNKTQIDNNNYTKAQTDSAINGALANYSEIKYLTMASGKYIWSDSDLEEFILSKIDEIKDRSLITIRNGNTIAVGECIISKQSNIYFSFIFHGYFIHKPKYYVYENGTWTVNALATESELNPTLTEVTTPSTQVTVLTGGYARIGNLVIVNIRFKTTVANTLISFGTSLPSPIAQSSQYIPCNVIDIQGDTYAETYGYKSANNNLIYIKVPKANQEYALSCTYICQ